MSSLPPVNFWKRRKKKNKGGSRLQDGKPSPPRFYAHSPRHAPEALQGCLSRVGQRISSPRKEKKRKKKPFLSSDHYQIRHPCPSLSFPSPVGTVTYHPRKLAPGPSSYVICEERQLLPRRAAWRGAVASRVPTMSPTMTRGRPGKLLLSPCLVARVPT
ncbi:hypothetical protein LY78DRAFT_485084 [Colletotrichum sublineola]|nr:hypothetical protein LY78DRAFT_485084 [Colletotrichum sublineola]